MANVKLSQIVALGGNPATTDYIVSTTSANTVDSLVTYAEALATMSGLAATWTQTQTFASGTITSSTTAVEITQTWNSSGTVFDAPLLIDVTNTASNALSVLFDFQVGGTSICYLNAASSAFAVQTTAGKGGTLTPVSTGIQLTGFAGSTTMEFLLGSTNILDYGVTTSSVWTVPSGQTINIAGTFESGGNAMTFPGSAATLAGLGVVQTWTAAQTFNNGDLRLAGSSSGTATLEAPATGGGTVTLPAGSVTLAALSVAQTWTAAQTFDNGDLILAGSSSGSATLEAPATGGGTVTLPAGSVTLAALSVAQTWSAKQSFNNGDLALNGSSSGSTLLEASATASGTITLPAVTDTVAVLGTADQTVSGGANVTSFSLGTQSSGTLTIDCGKCPLQYLTNGGAFTLAAPSNDGSCMVLVTNNGSAGTITFSGFSVGSNTGDALNTTNTDLFTISIWRINGTSGYRIAAHQ